MQEQAKAILLVDDERLNLDMLSRRLGRSGFHVEVAESGYQALECVRKREFDLVLLDHMMPGISGPEVLRQMREMYTPAELPVIMVTAVAESDKIVDALGAGANDYVTKPIDYPIALARIQVQLARREAEVALRKSEERYALAMEASRDALWDWNLLDGNLFYSPRWMEMLGLSASRIEISPQFWFDSVFAPDLPHLQACLDKSCQGLQDAMNCEYRMVDSQGSLRWMTSRAVVTRNEAGDVVRLSGSQSDVSDEKTKDTLTGLLNRLALVSRLEQLFLLAQRPGSDLSYALLFLDLDGFKTVNDSLGHLAGDHLLQIIARRLRNAVSLVTQTDADAALQSTYLIARMGGDEFAVLVESSAAESKACNLAKQVQEQMALPAQLEERTVHCAFSIGVAASSRDHTSANEIIHDADTAMYAVKTSGRGRVMTFSSEMRQEALERLELENDLCVAASSGQLRLLYQPKVRLKTGEVYGVEALVRWQHPTRGLIPPAMFIPVAESKGLILEIGQWVLRQACQQVAQWQKDYPAYAALELSVNLSPSEFRNERLVEDIRTVLQETQYRPELLHLEITEGVLFDDFEEARRVLGELHRLGILLDLDDFGSGFSSLRYLQELPFDTLKIDRYFISALDNGATSSAELIRTILMMAKTLELDVVAEGIETRPHRTALQELGCRYGQGYYYSKPVTPESFTAILTREQEHTAARREDSPCHGGDGLLAGLRLREAM